MIDIEQAVAAYNDQRKTIAATRSTARRKLIYIFGALAVLLVAVAVWCYFSGFVIGLYTLPIVGALGFFLVYRRLRLSVDRPGEDLQKTVRESIFPALFNSVEDLRFQANTKGFFDEIPDDIKPDATKYEWGDLIEGTYQGQSIAISEVTVFRTSGSGNNKETEQVFKGPALRIGLDYPVPNLSISVDTSAIKRWIKAQFRAQGDKPHVAFEDQKFEAIYTVHCENDAFANSVFSEAGGSTFMGLQGDLSRWPMQMAAKGNTAYVLLNHEKDFFELPALDRPFNMGTDGRRLQDEMQRILDLIEGVRDLLKTGATS